jgi:hypothetical protein
MTPGLCMSLRWKLILVCSMSALVAGCDTVFDQVVVVRVLNSQGQGVRDVSLRYYATANCMGDYVAGSTSPDGEARFFRKAIHGGIAVMLEEPSICSEHGGAWHSAWQEHIDPADQENFLCHIEEDQRLACERM